MTIHLNKPITLHQIAVLPASIEDYSLIQNMARFYIYDLSRECGHTSPDWALPTDGLYESFDFKNYFEDPSRKAYLIKVNDEIAGFVLLNQETEDKASNWNMGEFFIIARFQGREISKIVAHEIWKMNPGKWEVAVIPENKKALIFWEKAISNFTEEVFDKSVRNVAYDKHQPQRIIFMFDTKRKAYRNSALQAVIRSSILEDIEVMVSMSKDKRLTYEKAQPQFWCYAGPKAEQSQNKWFTELLSNQD